jgi:hypothetical protein
MKTQRDMPLVEALDEIASEVQQLKEDGSARLNGQEIGMDAPVTLEIEKEAGKKGGEMEFDIKWPAKGSAGADKPKRRIRRRWLLLGALAAVAAGAAVAVRRRRNQALDEEEDLVEAM